MSKSRQGMRRSHHGLKPKPICYCGRCGEAIRPHLACWNCGWSNVQEREVVAMKEEGEE
jgi:large subunit ribosomal protein L32